MPMDQNWVAVTSADGSSLLDLFPHYHTFLDKFERQRVAIAYKRGSKRR